MRWICRGFALLAVCSLLNPATGYAAGCGEKAICAGCQGYRTLGAPACAAPDFGTVPGCCQCQPSPCDNAWDGYCLEKSWCWRLGYRIGSRPASCGVAVPAGCNAKTVSSQGTEKRVPAPAVKPPAPPEPPEPARPIEDAEPGSELPPLAQPAVEKSASTWKGWLLW